MKPCHFPPSFAFPARPERPPSCPVWAEPHCQNADETPCGGFGAGRETLSTVIPLLDDGIHSVSTPPFTCGTATEWMPLSKCGDDGGRRYEAEPHPPSSCQTSAGTARRSGIHSVTSRNCTASACGTATVWTRDPSPVMTAEGDAKPCHTHRRHPRPAQRKCAGIHSRCNLVKGESNVPWPEAGPKPVHKRSANDWIPAHRRG